MIDPVIAAIRAIGTIVTVGAIDTVSAVCAIDTVGAIGTVGTGTTGTIGAVDATAVTTAVTVLKTTTLVLGALITYYAFEAYRRTRSRALRALVLGFGVVTLGSLLAGLVDRVLPLGADVALVVESAFTASGFAILLYSLRVE